MQVWTVSQGNCGIEWHLESLEAVHNGDQDVFDAPVAQIAYSTESQRILPLHYWNP